VFNIVKLTPAPEDLITGRRTEDHPPPIVIDGEVEWEVEEYHKWLLTWFVIEDLIFKRAYRQS